jgi:hypothetical protein
MIGVVSTGDLITYIMKHSRQHVVTEGVTTSHGTESTPGKNA